MSKEMNQEFYSEQLFGNWFLTAKHFVIDSTNQWQMKQSQLEDHCILPWLLSHFYTRSFITLVSIDIQQILISKTTIQSKKKSLKTNYTSFT